MTKVRRNDFLIPTTAVILDILSIEFSFLFSYWLRFNTNLLNFLPLTEAEPPLDAYVYGSFVIIPVWLLLFNSRRMYGARRNVSLLDEFLSIVKAVTLGMLIVMSAAFFYRAFSYSRIVFGILWITSAVTLTLGRALLLQFEKIIYTKGHNLRNAVIIGKNEAANRIFTALNNHPLLGYRMVGYFADTQCMDELPLSNSTYLGNLEEVPDRLIQENVELALIAMSHTEHPQIYKLVNKCEGVDIEFLLIPDLLEIMTSPDKFGLKEVEGIQFIKIKGVPMTTWGRITKRSFDLVVSFLLLLILSLFILVIAIAIKLGSKGPVFFLQERVGLDGKRFNVIKFRSMFTGAEKFDKHAGLGVRNDPRQTNIGKILRASSIDEIPQFINVLKGEMSLVGPRPERPFFVDQYKTLIPKYLDRHRVKTGITGWAQVNGLRGNSSLTERIKYDIYYIENWSIWFDIKILLKTVIFLFSKH